METMNRRLEVMDSTAISLCMDNNLPILVLNLWQENAFARLFLGARRHPGHGLNLPFSLFAFSSML